MRSVKVGIIGLGNIGCGTLSILNGNREILRERVGADIDVVRAADLDLDRPRAVEIPRSILTSDALEVIRDPEVQIVVELIGGIEPARSYILEAIDLGKHVVTANKALLSEHWQELVERAEEKGVGLLYEGSVGGGIPLVRTIKVGLVANRISSVTGIINGTCNYILSKMSSEKLAFEDALANAKGKGYAEADPDMDVEGVDAAQKLSILVNLCFGVPVSYKDLPYKGITELTPLDFETAEEFGYEVKLLASARNAGSEIQAWVHPALVPVKHPLAAVHNVYNAVYIEDDNLGPSLYYGRGAGDLPTGSAVAADIVSCSRDILSGAMGRVPVGCSRKLPVAGQDPRIADDDESEFYVRVTARDRPGVLSAISGILAEKEISISSVIQRGREPVEGGGVPIVMIIHEASHSDMVQALEAIDAMDETLGKSFYMRILPDGDEQ